MQRRTFIKLMGLGAVGGSAAYFWPDEGVWNPCLHTGLPDELANHELVKAAWEDIDANAFWDVHTHLIGVGDSDSGIYLHPSMRDWMSPAQHVRYHFYINASCADSIATQSLDAGFLDYAAFLLRDFPAGAKCMLLAFDYHYDEQGRTDKARSPFYTPNEYAASIAAAQPERFEWVASVHPYREDCVEQLHAMVKAGAKAVKWLPPVMGIDPASPKCDRFYNAIAQLGIPLLTHAGDEHAVDGVDAQAKGNPLLLRRALEHGVKVVVAHCASQGMGVDLDKGPNAKRVPNFDLFARMMQEPQYEGLLYGDISAMTQLNRIGPALQTVLQQEDWHPRLLNGSDYPLPGVMPLYSTKVLSRYGYLPESAVPVLKELRQYNPLLFDFVLKRHLQWQGKRFSPIIFHTRTHFK